MKISLKADLLVKLLPFVDSTQIRHNIHSIRFEGGRAVVTNGYYQVCHMAPLAEKTDSFNLTIPKKLHSSILSALKKSAKKNLDVTYDTEAATLTVLIDGIQTFNLEKTDETFPDWKRVIPDTVNLQPVSVSLSAKYLGLYQGLCDNGIVIYGTDERSACVIIPNMREPDWFAVQMPMRAHLEADKRTEIMKAHLFEAKHLDTGANLSQAS